MLEVRNLKKTYALKGNIVTKALDDVSIKFPEKGMVFLLGKSGSGKSTLLNICGGLDICDSGEVIVKGRSSSTFSKKDFDAYRNTFIGFIFQEYNILDEFTVEDNIALALELQGKPKDKKKIEEILKLVDLDNFAKRKPNTLSGGQKQRIAIARALIKEPQIIMADEPTGALDSNTGKQVFDTLKKLSSTKLVIIVSHDQEFANQYADRIIELKDGKIVSDYTKESITPKNIGNITKIDENTISIKNSNNLSNDDLKLLNEFIKTSNNEILLTNDNNQIKRYKKMAKINENGDKEVFVKTDETNIELKQYSKEDSTLIRSKLPLYQAIKIGISSLKLKPGRLIFTIMLSAISFILLAVVSTMTFYNKNDVILKSLMNSENQYINVQKGYYAQIKYDKNYQQEINITTNFSNNDKDRLIDEYGSQTILYYTFNGMAPLGQTFTNEEHKISNVNIGSSLYYSSNIMGFAKLDTNHPLIRTLLAGRYPTSSNEMLISSYTFDSIRELGLRDENRNTIPLNDYNDIIGKTVYLRNSTKPIIICGIFDVDNLIPYKYKDIINNVNSTLVYDWETERKMNVYSLAIVDDGFYNEYKNELMINSNALTEIATEEINLGNLNVSTIGHDYDFKLYNLNQNEINDDNTIYVSSDIIYSLIQELIDNSDNEELTSKLISMNNELYQFAFGESLSDEVTYITLDDRLQSFNTIYDVLVEYNVVGQLFKNIVLTQNATNKNLNVNIGGFVFNNSGNILVLNDKLFNELYVSSDNTIITSNYKIDKDAIYTGAFIYNNRNINDLKKLLSEYKTRNNDDSILNINNSIFNSIEYVDSFFDIMTTIFLYAGIILAVFSTMLLFNFISMSITNKRREIGILRAVGAKGNDVFKIFFSESFVIVFICLVISIICSYSICSVINNKLGQELNGISLLVFGGKSCTLLIVLSILVSFISTFLPVYNIAKKKPVESIKAL